MRHFCIASLLYVLFCPITISQSTFKRTYGGSGNEQGVWMDMLSDGSFAVCGRTTTSSNGGWDALLVKFSASGNIEWSNNFGSGQDEILNMVKSTTDGGFIVIGITYLSGTSGDLLAAKLDAGGNIVWQRHFGTGSTLEEGRGICLLADGYLFCGHSGSASSPIMYIVKTDFDGNLVWAKTSIGRIASEAIVANNGEIWVTAGYAGDGAIIRLNDNGNLLGVLQLSGAANEALYSIKSTGDGYIASDHTWAPSGGIQRPWLVKLNNSGGVVWSKSYNLGANGRAVAEVASDGGFIFSIFDWGITSPQALLVKTNGTGDILWTKLHTYPFGSGSLRHVKEAPDGGFVAIGYCNVTGNGTDLIVFKTDAMGNIMECCPTDFNITVQVYNPNQLSPSPPLTDLNNNTESSFTSSNVSLTETDRCNGPSCCITDAGTMQGSLQSVCLNQTATFIHNGDQVLDNTDILSFILYSNPNDPAGSILAANDMSNFIFGPPMQTGMTYYVAAIAGNNNNGNVDLNDPCLDISNAAQIIWRPLPTVMFMAANPNVCAGACTSITATFTRHSAVYT